VLDGWIFPQLVGGNTERKGERGVPLPVGWRSCRRGVRAGEWHQDFKSGRFPLKFCAVGYEMV